MNHVSEPREKETINTVAYGSIRPPFTNILYYLYEEFLNFNITIVKTGYHDYIFKSLLTCNFYIFRLVSNSSNKAIFDIMCVPLQC